MNADAAQADRLRQNSYLTKDSCAPSARKQATSMAMDDRSDGSGSSALICVHLWFDKT
jgi:hypothetical protein